MSSSSYSIEKSKRSGFTLTLNKRVLLILLACSIQMIYIPTSLFMEGGISPRLPWDVFPLVVGWVIPYILCYPLWALAMFWLIWKMDDRQFHAAIASFFLTFTLGNLIFILIPTYVVLPPIVGTDILSKILIHLQVAGGDHDAFPSPHIYITVLFALLYSNWYPKFKWLWLAIVLIVSLSTLFTGQHYILDVFGGIITGWLGYRFGLWWNSIYGRRMKSANA